MSAQAPRRVDHIVVLMLENRAFDHFLGFLEPRAGQSIDGLLGDSAARFNLFDPAQPESASNPRISVGKAAPDAVHDKMGPPHSFHAVLTSLCNQNTGPDATHPVLNNGFVKAYKDDLLRRTHHVDEAQIGEVMQSFTASHIPAITQLAQSFCVCDHWHCEVPGPTMPNRMYVHAATSEGYVHNAFNRDFSSKTIYELFQDRGLTWATYFHDLNEVIQFKNLPTKDPARFRRFEERWDTDVQSGQLPNYSFILPRFMNKKATNNQPRKMANSQHAPEDVRFGDLLIAQIYESLAKNMDVFKRTLLIVTYDEHGGFYDHVAPGPAPNPDGQNSPNPDDQANFTPPAFAFDRLGLRVPTVLVSPWLREGTVEHRLLQHTSIISTAREIFKLGGPLNARDKSAASFADLLQQLPAPRSANEMPATLHRPSMSNLPTSSVAGVAVAPEDEPLDDLTSEWVQGFAELVARRAGAMPALTTAAKAPPPTTQGEASEFVEQRMRQVLGV